MDEIPKDIRVVRKNKKQAIAGIEMGGSLCEEVEDRKEVASWRVLASLYGRELGRVFATSMLISSSTGKLYIKVGRIG